MELQKRNEDNLSSRFSDQEEKILFGFFANLRSKKTREAYKIDLVQFGSYLYKMFRDIKIINTDHDHIVSYKNFLSKHGGKNRKPASLRTINRKISSLSKFYDYLGNRGLVSRNPCEFIERAKIELNVTTNELSSDQVKRLFGLLSDESESLALHKAVIMTLFTTGMRVSELCNLKRAEFKSVAEGKAFHYRAKGGRTILKRLSNVCIEAIEKYLSYKIERKEEYLFSPTRNPFGENSTNKKLQRSSINYILKKYVKLAGLEDLNISPHSARATVISELRENGWDIQTVASYVGHQDVNMTIAYDKRRESLNNDPSDALKYLSEFKDG